jgi:hypothetical protein
MSSPRNLFTTLGEGICLGLSSGVCVWILGRPRPADPHIVQTTQHGLLAGLPTILAITVAAGVCVAFVLRPTAIGRCWLGRIALSSCALYLSAAAAAIGPLACVLGAACTAIACTMLAVRGDAPETGAVLTTLHAGAFGMALAFFEQWPRYRAGWHPLVENLTALRRLWLGS